MNASLNKFPVLIRREFWEHRVLWMAPVAVALLYIVTCLIPGGVSLGGVNVGHVPVSQERAVVVFAGIQLVFTALQFSLMSVVAFFYLGDCLYAERKDRSILFWKSLPVSDSQTVLSKLLVALLVLPLGVYLLAVVTNLIAFGILHVRFHDSVLVQSSMRWDTSVWLRLNGYLLADLLVLGLWYAPVAAYQLLISAWAKSSVLVWTVLPPLALILGERLFFGTWTIARVIGHRLGSGMFNFAGMGFGMADIDRSHAANIDRVFHGVNALPLLGTADLWLGAALAAALVFGTIRIRRYRDDS